MDIVHQMRTYVLILPCSNESPIAQMRPHAELRASGVEVIGLWANGSNFADTGGGGLKMTNFRKRPL